MARDWEDSVRRARNGDREAFAWLVDRFKGPICATISPILMDWHQTQDVAQETFCLAFERLGELREASSFKAWLYSIARNHAVDRARKRRISRTLSLDTMEEKEVVGTIGGRSCTMDPRKGALRPGPNVLESVRRVLMALPNDYGTLLALRHVDGLNLTEIAQVFDCTASSVKSALYRARVMAREVLRRAGLDLEKILYEM